MHAPEAPLVSFEDAVAWIVEHATREGLEHERIHDFGGACEGVKLARGRARVVVTRGGGFLPQEFGVLLVLGTSQALADAIAGLGSRRVLTQTLPTPAALLRHSIREALAIADAVGRARVADQLVEVGMALNQVRDPRRVLAQILGYAREITAADAGSIYTVEDGGAQLRLMIAHNDSRDADYTEFSFPVSEHSIVGASVLSGRVINLHDLYSSAGRTALGRTFTHDRSLDERFGYQTRSMLTVPMSTPEGEVLGAFQLINAKRDRLPLRGPGDFDRRVVTFSEQDALLCSSLATQGAVALENARLYRDIQELFEGFVRASVLAIEQRDPTTSGHSERVAGLTLALARTLDRVVAPKFADVRFSDEALREIEYAALLHDFGKVGVREEILVKAKKLHPSQLALVMARFEHLRTVLKVRMLEAQLARARAGRAADDDDAPQREYAEALATVEEWRAVVARANEPSILPEEVGSRIHVVAAQRFETVDGGAVQLLDGPELDALLIRRGSLTPAERREVQSHVSHTYEFLSKIPWGRALARVPIIAGAHHEYLNGTGYPRGASAPQIPIQARMMTIADIFDALTAADRPYKKAVPVDRALDILGLEADAGKIDRDILEVFIGARVFEVPGAGDG
ncbi:MAG: GAF domain-containing protein [Myxococcales bacterium]|nr:GAF domain-containing protein [Myxococcales bacterium]MCB9756121.1 GAF domain-containing protein [Myxococcales bacterium]